MKIVRPIDPMNYEPLPLQKARPPAARPPSRAPAPSALTAPAKASPPPSPSRSSRR